ncbi:YHS domain-containing protein, partial [Klebsiella pneumoniae]
MPMTFLLMAALSAMTVEEKPLVCAVMPDNSVNNKAAGMEYAGAKYTFCCGMCPGAFKKDPAKYVKTAAESDTVVGTSLFDAVTGARIDLKKAK